PADRSACRESTAHEFLAALRLCAKFERRGVGGSHKKIAMTRPRAAKPRPASAFWRRTEGAAPGSSGGGSPTAGPSRWTRSTCHSAAGTPRQAIARPMACCAEGPPYQPQAPIAPRKAPRVAVPRPGALHGAGAALSAPGAPGICGAGSMAAPREPCAASHFGRSAPKPSAAPAAAQAFIASIVAASGGGKPNTRLPSPSEHHRHHEQDQCHDDHRQAEAEQQLADLQPALEAPFHQPRENRPESAGGQRSGDEPGRIERRPVFVYLEQMLVQLLAQDPGISREPAFEPPAVPCPLEVAGRTQARCHDASAGEDAPGGRAGPIETCENLPHARNLARGAAASSGTNPPGRALRGRGRRSGIRRSLVPPEEHRSCGAYIRSSSSAARSCTRARAGR